MPTLGFYLLEARTGFVENGWVVLVGPFAVGLGIFISHSNRSSNPFLEDREWLPPFIKHSLIVLSCLAVVHFSITGIAIFNANVEVSRFDLGGSGLAGFPSRAVLYGIPALAMISLATVTKATRRLTILTWVVYCASQLALGFKAALLEVLVVAAIASSIKLGKMKLRYLALFAVGVACALSYALVVGSAYSTIGAGSDWTYIAERSTTQAIQAGYTALQYKPSLGDMPPVFIGDLIALLGKYTGSSDGPTYPFDLQISSIVTGTELGQGVFIVPVTVGGPVYLLFSMAWPFVLVFLVSLGLAWTWAVRTLGAPNGIIVALVSALTLTGVRTFLLNGGGAYLVINLAFTLLLMLVCATPTLLSRRRSAISPAGFTTHGVRNRSARWRTVSAGGARKTHLGL